MQARNHGLCREGDLLRSPTDLGGGLPDEGGAGGVAGTTCGAGRGPGEFVNLRLAVAKVRFALFCAGFKV